MYCNEIIPTAENLKLKFKSKSQLSSCDLKKITELIIALNNCKQEISIIDTNNLVKTKTIFLNDLIFLEEDIKSAICENILSLPESERTILDSESKWNIKTERLIT